MREKSAAQKGKTVIPSHPIVELSNAIALIPSDVRIGYISCRRKLETGMDYMPSRLSSPSTELA